MLKVKIEFANVKLLTHDVTYFVGAESVHKVLKELGANKLIDLKPEQYRDYFIRCAILLHEVSEKISSLEKTAQFYAIAAEAK